MDVLLVDDHPEVRLSLADFLEQLGHNAVHAGSGEEALRLIRERHPGLVITDLRMPGMTGLELLEALEDFDDPPPLALMTAHGEADTAINAMRHGAIDYLRKPIDVRELHRLVERVSGDRKPVVSTGIHEERDGLLVVGVDFERLVDFADRLHEAADLPCLIEGETGVGKELFARRIHHGGKPSAGAFVALNCAAIAPGLFEAELFGYAPGAFTGAVQGGAAGKLALAAGGTIFLDEVGDLPLDQQAKLLRLLEDRAWYPVGGNQLQRLTARVVCATNVGLLDRVRTHRFREDLYYRLKVGHLRIPALRDRRDAIVPLARALLARVAQRRGRGSMQFSPDAEAVLLAHPWPGNVRELVHLLEQVLLMVRGAVVDKPLLATLIAGGESLPAPSSPSPAPLTGHPRLALPRLPPAELALDAGGFPLDEWQRAIIAAALAANDGSPVRTAAYLGITRKVLYTLRKRYGLFTSGQDEADGQ